MNIDNYPDDSGGYSIVNLESNLDKGNIIHICFSLRGVERARDESAGSSFRSRLRTVSQLGRSIVTGNPPECNGSAPLYYCRRTADHSKISNTIVNESSPVLPITLLKMGLLFPKSGKFDEDYEFFDWPHVDNINMSVDPFDNDIEWGRHAFTFSAHTEMDNYSPHPSWSLDKCQMLTRYEIGFVIYSIILFLLGILANALITRLLG